MRDGVGRQTHEIGHQAGPLLELDHGDGQRVVEGGDLGMVDDDVAVDGASSRGRDRVPVEGTADGAGRARRMAQRPARGAALDEELAAPGPVEEEGVVLGQQPAGAAAAGSP